MNVDGLVPVLGDYINGDNNNVIFKCPKCERLLGNEYDSVKRYYRLWVHKSIGKYKCFQCDLKGQNFPQLYKYLGNSIPIEENFIQQITNLCYPEEKIDFSVAEFYLPDFISDIVPGTLPYEYLTVNRQIDASLIEYYKFKSCLVFYAEVQKYLTSIMFPIYEDGEIVFWQARAITEKLFKNIKAKKEYFLFNINHPFETTVLTEGYLSAVSAGLDGVCASGKDLSDIQFKLLIKKNSKITYLCLDNDFFENNIILADKLVEYLPDVRIIILPDGKDPNDVIHTFSRYRDEAIKYNRNSISQRMLLRSHISTEKGLNKLNRYFGYVDTP